jgi:hypothetical protein
MNKTYNTDRGSCRIIIKRISNATKRMDTKLMACMMLSKCHKEEVPFGVFAAATQSANDTILNWAPYLLNMFLDDCKDAQDLGIKFHYLWSLILIALIGWREIPYSHSCEKIGRFHAAKYTSLGRTSDPKHRSGNTGTFAWYFSEIHESIENSWIITPEVVAHVIPQG